MSESLCLEPIAEGVECLEDLAGVRAAGCRLGQGFLFGRPVPAGEFHRAMAEDLVATRGAAV